MMAQNRVRTVTGSKWLQNLAADVLGPVEQLIIKVFDQLGGRRLVHSVRFERDLVDAKSHFHRNRNV